MIRDLIAVNLELEGFDVTVAGDGEEALERVAEQRPDVITLDVVMLRLDGFETATRLRADPAYADSRSSWSPPRRPTWPAARSSASTAT